MTIDKAIRYNTSLYRCLEKDTDPMFLEALKLGIEALQRFRDVRHSLYLPGETED